MPSYESMAIQAAIVSYYNVIHVKIYATIVLP